MHLMKLVEAGWLAENLTEVELRVVRCGRDMALQEGRGEHVHAAGLRIALRRLQVRRDTRAIQLHVIVIRRILQRVGASGSVRRRRVQILRHGRLRLLLLALLLVFERVQERVLAASSRRRLLVVEIVAAGVAAGVLEGFLGAGLAQNVRS